MSRLLGREVLMFRCVVDPMVGPKPRQAFVPKDCGMEAHVIDEGIHVKVLPYNTFLGTEHIIPYTNILSMKVALEDLNDNVSHLDEVKRKPGRPVGS